MPRPTIHFNDYVSLAIMLLMSVALIAGQADASVDESESATAIGSIVLFEDRSKLEISGLISEKALEISISVVNDLGHFRGEDE